MLAQTALKYDVEVNKDGQVELTVPFPAGAHVTVFVVDAGDCTCTLPKARSSRSNRTPVGCCGEGTGPTFICRLLRPYTSTAS